MAFRKDFSNLSYTKLRIQELDKILEEVPNNILEIVLHDLETETYNLGGIAKWASLFVRQLKSGVPYEIVPHLWYNDFADNTYVPVTKKAIELWQATASAFDSPIEEGYWKDRYFEVLNPKQKEELFEWLDRWIHSHNHDKGICKSLAEYISKYLAGDPKITLKTYQILDNFTNEAAEKLKSDCLFYTDSAKWIDSMTTK